MKRMYTSVPECGRRGDDVSSKKPKVTVKDFCFCNEEDKVQGGYFCQCYFIDYPDDGLEFNPDGADFPYVDGPSNPSKEVPCKEVIEVKSKPEEVQVAKRRKQLQIAAEFDPQGNPCFIKSVPSVSSTKQDTASSTERRTTGGGNTCARYSRTEEKALVHAKLRLQIGGFVGLDETSDKLLEYYEYYLQQLAPEGFMKFPIRENSALIRKYKAIKHKHNQDLTAFLDPNIESKFWYNLIQLVSHKPLLHAVFYAGKDLK